MSSNVEAIGLQDVRNLLRETPGHLFDATKVAFKRSVFSVHRKVSNNVRSGAGGTLKSRTGQLRRSLRTDVFGTNLKTLGGEVYSDKGIAKYAKIHEFGGVVKAKNAYKNLDGSPYLNIPSSFNRTAAGVQRLSAGDVFRNGGYIIPIKSGKARYAVMQDGIPMFWLVNQITIPARLGMFNAATKEVPTLLSNISKLTSEELNK